MTLKELDVIRNLREQGYAVVVYDPAEFDGLFLAKHLEDLMVDIANTAIDDMIHSQVMGRELGLPFGDKP